MSSDVVNNHLIHVCAPQRSGHHAVIQWILLNARGHDDPVWFLNNCKPHTNPFESAIIRESFLPMCDLVAERAGRFRRKTLLVCNYEDVDLPAMYIRDFAPSMTAWLGSCERCTGMLVLRDPFNLFASKYRWALGKIGRPSMESITALPALWKTYAREFIGATSHVQGNVVHVSYNRWFSDEHYRRQLAIALGISPADLGRARVARWGPNSWGDSFDNLTFDGRATEMKVFERWKNFESDSFFRSLFRDPELFELSARIFGELPGTDELMR